MLDLLIIRRRSQNSPCEMLSSINADPYWTRHTKFLEEVDGVARAEPGQVSAELVTEIVLV
jgi:hypothetical protein